MSQSAAPSPKLTFHPESKRRSLSMSFPDMRGVVGGAHFTAASEHIEEEREVLRHVSSHLSGSDVKLEGKRRQVVEDVMELFCSRPTAEIFERSWKKDAEFADPLSRCHGYHEYAPQWYGLAKLFPKSRTLKMNVISSTFAPEAPNRIVYEQEQEYTLKLIGHKQVIRSLVVIDLDENDMITKLEDKWDGKDLPSRFGSFYLRRMNARVLPWFVKVPDMKN